MVSNKSWQQTLRRDELRMLRDSQRRGNGVAGFTVAAPPSLMPGGAPKPMGGAMEGGCLGLRWLSDVSILT